MNYEVRRGSVVLAHTEHVKCIDNQEKMLALVESGYSIYIDGTRLNKKDIPIIFSGDAFSYDTFNSLKK